MAKAELTCIVDGHNGIYTPQVFAERHRGYLKKDDCAILLEGPDNECYWEVWSEVLDYCKVGDFTIYQGECGDVFYVPAGCTVDDCGEIQSLDDFVSLVELANSFENWS